MPESEWQQRRAAVLAAAGNVIRTIGKIDQVGLVVTWADTDRTHNLGTYLRADLVALRSAAAALLVLLPPSTDNT